MKKKDIATTIALTVILLLLVVMLGGCAKDLTLDDITLEGTTEPETITETEKQEEIEIIKTEPDTVIEICEDGQLSEIQVNCLDVSKESIRNHIMDFSTELFKNSVKKEKNTLISPVSVMMALSMMGNGAKGETLAELENVFGTSIETLDTYFWEYQGKLPKGEDYRLYIANSIWINNDMHFSVNPDFIRENQNYYYAGIYKSHFNQNIIKHINSWVTENTKGMITDIISEIPESTMMYMINALAFDAKWETPYKEHSVRTDTFTKENGETQEVSFMHSTEGGLLEDENTIGFTKYYKNGTYAFVGLLPKEGISMEEYVATLSGEKIRSLLSNQRRSIVYASLPKFENECMFNMIPILEKMGIETAFNVGKADLSGIGTYEDVNTYIGSVTHKTYISVAEQGTKAGAVTAITDNAKSAMMEVQEVRLNRPFVYMIMDCEENLPLFMGVVTDVVKK